MALPDLILEEVEQEFDNTRKILERVPADKFDWKPHDKSMSLKTLATHIAALASFTGMMLTSDELDFATASWPEVNSTEDVLGLHDKGAENTKKALQKATEGDFDKEFVFRNGNQIIMKMPIRQFIRKMALSHIYHHRAQLGVYLRLLDVPIPGMYGPSADDEAAS